jgi:hypothetical protein
MFYEAFKLMITHLISVYLHDQSPSTGVTNLVHVTIDNSRVTVENKMIQTIGSIALNNRTRDNHLVLNSDLTNISVLKD